MGTGETSKEWAERTGQGELSAERLDFPSTQGGVANALWNSGNAFLGLKRKREAIERYDRVIAMGERDPELRLDMVTAQDLKRKALSS